LKFNRRFGGNYRQYHQGSGINQARNQHEISGKHQTGSRAYFLLHSGFSLGLFFDHEDGGGMFF
jgi:hypothetical protein